LEGALKDSKPKKMKNLHAKVYEGPKNYKKLIEKIPKLYSLSKKQLKKKNPFYKETFVMESLTRSSLPLVSLDTSPPLRASSLQEGSYEVIDGVSHPRGVTPTSYEP